jgi:hypothetical protein
MCIRHSALTCSCFGAGGLSRELPFRADTSGVRLFEIPSVHGTRFEERLALVLHYHVSLSGGVTCMVLLLSSKAARGSNSFFGARLLQIAASTVFLSQFILQIPCWTPTLAHYSDYKAMELKECVKVSRTNV